jgi:outer membrane DcaP-like protein
MRRQTLSWTAVSWGLAAALASTARADDLEDLKRSQEELRKLVEQQQREIERLSGKLAPRTDAGADSPSLSSAIDELSRQQDNSGPVVWKQISKLGSKFTLYGFLRLDAQYDHQRMNNPQLPAWVRTSDDFAPDSIRTPDDAHTFDMHPKLTRLGLDFDGPNVCDAKLTGKLETDFYNATGTNSRAALRMRHAYLKLTWPNDVSLLAGQTQDVIAPLNPIVNNDFVMWGAGNLGDRRPQLRLEWTPEMGAGNRLILQGMVGDTGAVDGKDLDPAGTTGAGTIDGEQSGRPTFQARAAWRMKNWDEKDVEVGVWIHGANERNDADVGGHHTYRSRAIGLDAKVPFVSDTLWVQGEIWRGRNLTDVRGGILQGVNTTAGDEIRARGGFLELGWKTSSWLTLYTGIAVDDPDNGDLSDGGLEGGRSRNRIWYAAARMNWNPIEVGLEFLHWQTDFIGFDKGLNNRVAAFVAYKF